MAELKITPSSLNFGQVVHNETAIRYITIEAVGGPITVNSVLVSSSVFKLEYKGFLSGILRVGEIQRIVVEFTPVRYMTYNDFLTIKYDSNYRTNVPMTGTGVSLSTGGTTTEETTETTTDETTETTTDETTTGEETSDETTDEETGDETTDGDSTSEDTTTSEPHPEWPPCNSVVPPASVLASEFYNLQDLNGDGKIYGYDFKITDDTHVPPWKPIVLILLENSPYWANPTEEQDWLSYLESAGYTSTSSGSSSSSSVGSSVGSSGGYKLSYVTSIKQNADMLWHLATDGKKLYAGSYTLTSDSSKKPQYYYESSSPFTSWSEKSVGGVNNYESSRPYYFGQLYVILEGYGLGKPNSVSMGGYWVMCGVNANKPIFARYAKDTGAFTYDSSGTKINSSGADLWPFTATVFNGSIYMLGSVKEKYRTGPGSIVKYDLNGKYIKTLSGSSFGTITCSCVFNNKLYFGAGTSGASIGYIDNSDNVTKDQSVSGMGMFGDMKVFDNCLFASVFPNIDSAPRPQLMKCDSSGTWSIVFSQSDFTSAKSFSGSSYSLTGWNGELTVVDNKLYMLVADTSGKVGPTYLFLIEGDGTSSSESSGSDEIDLSKVNWLSANVSSWKVTTNLNSVSTTTSNITLSYDDVNWASKDEGGTQVNANCWVFIPTSNGWDAATWEFLKPNQEVKDKNAVAGDHIKISPYDASSGWKPTVGLEYGFMISGLCRAGLTNVSERSNIKLFKWS